MSGTYALTTENFICPSGSRNFMSEGGGVYMFVGKGPPGGFRGYGISSKAKGGPAALPRKVCTI